MLGSRMLHAPSLEGAKGFEEQPAVELGNIELVPGHMAASQVVSHCGFFLPRPLRLCGCTGRSRRCPMLSTAADLCKVGLPSLHCNAVLDAEVMISDHAAGTQCRFGICLQ